MTERMITIGDTTIPLNDVCTAALGINNGDFPEDEICRKVYESPSVVTKNEWAGIVADQARAAIERVASGVGGKTVDGIITAAIVENFCRERALLGS